MAAKQAETSQLVTGPGRVRVTRVPGWTDRHRSYAVFCDGVCKAKVALGQHAEFEVAPGRHRLQIRIDWCTSNTVEFEAAGERVEFECGSTLRGWRLLLITFVVFRSPDQYLWLKRVTS